MVKCPYLLLLLLIFTSFNAIAQRPAIVSVDKSNGPMKDKVVISGSDFGTDASKLKVYFGGAAATINSVGNQLLEVQIPSGATYDNISVTNITNGLTGYSIDQFFVNFNGAHGLTASNFATQVDFQAQSGLYDLCLCDFNGDNKVDIGTANDNSNSLAVFQNGSSPGSVSLSAVSNLPNAKTLHSACGDLNGDGKPDMVVSEAQDGDRIFIFRNTGSLLFTIQSLKLTGRKVKRVAIADLDLNGKPELIVSDKGSNVITIFPNQSTTSAISFGTPVTFTIPGAAKMDALEIKDLNNNGLPEIVTSQFNTSLSNIYICDNKSSSGTFNFNDITTLNLTNSVVNVRIGDLDGDQKPDIAATRFLGSDISIFLNQSTATQLSFSDPTSILTATWPFGLDLGDLDGDGKTDIAVASISDKSITVLNNESTPGTLSFKPMLSVPTTYITRHIRIGDIDGDGKPDLAYTSVDDNSAGVAASKISVIRNLSCFVPVASPKGPLSICSGFPLKLTSIEGGGVTYDWQKDGGSVKTGAQAFFDVTASGSYTVTATSEGGSCVKTSNAISVTVSSPGAGLTGTGTASSNSPVCVADHLDLQVNDVGATEYRWKGPNGFTATGRTPSISNFTIAGAGVYTVEMVVGSCIAQTATTTVEGVTNPDFTVAFSGSSQICQGTPKILSISPAPTSGYTFQWSEKTNGIISGETNATYSVTASGEYSVKVTSPFAGCSPKNTPFAKLTAVAVPVAAFTPSATNACVGQIITFANQSTTDSQATPSYTWTFGDSNTDTNASPTKTYANPGTYPVKLVVTYENGACPSEITKNITVITAPPIQITTTANISKICPGDTLSLGVTGDTFTSYSWSTGAATPTIVINEASNYTVTVTNAAGCIIQKGITIEAFDLPTIKVIPDNSEIKVGANLVLNATGGQTYIWRPSVGLSDSTSANPVASPLQTISYVVYGKDINGCTGSDTVNIRVTGTSALDLITPSLYFSPNNEGPVDTETWMIGNVESFPQCTISIYDGKGAKVFETKGYDNKTNNWNGTFKGNMLPQGVYYYVIRCDDEAGVKTGSITLLK